MPGPTLRGPGVRENQQCRAVSAQRRQHPVDHHARLTEIVAGIAQLGKGVAVSEGRPLLDLLAEHPEINKHLGRDALAELCDPGNYLGQSGVMVDRVLATLR